MNTHSDLDEEEIFDLESLVDKRGIDSVLMALSTICGLKSEHVSHHWQDTALARQWAVVEGAIGVIVPKATGL